MGIGRIMKHLYSWCWEKKWFPPEVQSKRGNIVKIIDVYLSEPEKVGDVTRFHNNSLCLVTGDGGTLPKDVIEFDSWKLPHDLYCVNRSMLFFQRQVDHWAAVDIEESIWFAENVGPNVEPEKRIIRHTIGEKTLAYDIYWKMGPNYSEIQRRLLVGSTGYFAVLTALNMGYEKVVLAGMNLDFDPHWYEPDATEGPHWGGWTYAQWMDFKMLHPKADRVKSMGGYSGFILGTATKDWANGA